MLPGVQPVAAIKPPGAASSPSVATALAASAAANPQASRGGYEGSTAMQDPVGAMPDPYEYTDPILLKIQAANVAARANARASALAQQKQLAIQFGDATGLIDDPTAAAEASGNPYSTLATLLKSYKDTAHQHDEDLNKQNLFFSGAREKQLGEDANNYQHSVYDARNNALSALTGIQSGLVGALTGADQTDMQAETDAAGRASQRAATYGYDPGAQTSSVTNQGAPPLASAIVAPKAPVVKPKVLANAYLTNPNKRG